MSRVVAGIRVSELILRLFIGIIVASQTVKLFERELAALPSDPQRRIAKLVKQRPMASFVVSSMLLASLASFPATIRSAQSNSDLLLSEQSIQQARLLLCALVTAGMLTSLVYYANEFRNGSASSEAVVYLLYQMLVRGLQAEALIFSCNEFINSFSIPKNSLELILLSQSSASLKLFGVHLITRFVFAN